MHVKLNNLSIIGFVIPPQPNHCQILNIYQNIIGSVLINQLIELKIKEKEFKRLNETRFYRFIFLHSAL